MPLARLKPWLHPEGSLQLEFPDYGYLDFRFGSGEVVFLSLYGADRRFPQHPLAAHGAGSFAQLSQPASYVLRPDGQTALLGAHESLYFFDAATGELKMTATLRRWNEGGFGQLAIHDLGFLFLCHYENGLVSVSESGDELWSLTRVMWCWQFLGVADGLLRFIDADGRSRFFETEGGAERAV